MVTVKYNNLKELLFLDLPELFHLLFLLLFFLLSLLVFLELSFLFIPFFSISWLFLRCQVWVALCFCLFQTVYYFIYLLFHCYNLYLQHSIKAYNVFSLNCECITSWNQNHSPRVWLQLVSDPATSTVKKDTRPKYKTFQLVYTRNTKECIIISMSTYLHCDRS